MKRLIPILLLISACESSTTYVNHSENAYAVADDTLIIETNLIVNRTGFHKIRNGKLLPKEFKVIQWTRQYGPTIRFDAGHAYWNNTIYRKLP